MAFNLIMAQDDAVARLARQIDATRKAEHFLVSADAVAALRRQGATDLHRICADFVASVNCKLAEPALELSPPAYAPEMFHETGVNLIQIGSQGRQLQIAFEATPELVSTEKFAVAYTLEGEVRAYNEQMLRQFQIRSYMLFLCVEKETTAWRFFDWRTLHAGPLSRDLLASLMQQLF